MLNLEQEMTIRRLVGDPAEFEWMVGRMERGAKTHRNNFDETEENECLFAGIDALHALYEFARERFQP